VNNLYAQSCGGCNGCNGCGRDDCEYCNGGKKSRRGGLSKLKHHCCCCDGIHSTCDLYPHYAYYPMHHGYYYFRPYNYTTVLLQQGQIVKMGGDPRNPYSAQLIANINVPSAVPTTSPTRLLRQGPTLPLLEDLLPPRPY
jgi:hypothetical protein